MAFTVTQDLITGNAQIDKEHVELFAKINDFMEACSQGKGRSEIMETVKFLRNYTNHHFNYEETIQKRHDYPHYAVHKGFHDKFNRSMDEIVSQFEKEGVSIALVAKINLEIGSNLIAHIKTEDVRLAKFLQSEQG